MKAPLSWLKDYVDIDCSAEELEKKLFSCGFEVEELIYVGKNIDKIVVAKILEIAKHPDADKLNVCKIDAGKYGILQIVTSAKNITEGNLVPVALDGATLNNGERIFNGKLRGVVSNGMFCSGEELGITDEFYKGASVNGILILNEDYPLGEEVKKVLGIEDVIFDISVTANRPDCQSIVGIAREISAVLSKPFKMPNLKYTANKNIKTADKIKITNNATDLCPRYIGHYIDNIKIGESPDWIKKRLYSVGIKSINNIVDITNFVLTEIGQPMHAFDYNNIAKSEIIIRRAKENEKIVTLDEKEFTLKTNNLVICDGEKPVALAGIMGGLNSEIKSNTSSVVFECAKFLRDNIRKSSRSLGQKSDSSSRYEKGIDAYSAEIGMKRALHLVEELKVGEIAEGEYDLPKNDLKEKIIKTKISKINGVLGIKINSSVIKSILERLFFKVKISNDDIEVTVPLFREDMESYQDLAEEIIREYGYDNITGTLLDKASITVGGLSSEQKTFNSVKNFMCEMGFNEIITYSFVSTKDFETYSLSADNAIKIKNPLGEDLSIMRVSLVPSMVNIIAKNLNRKNMEGRLFETARIYSVDKPLEGDNLPCETNYLSFGAYGDNEDFYSMKGYVEALFDTFAEDIKVKYVRSKLSYFHPTISADIINEKGEVIGSFGALSPVIAEKAGIDKRIYVGEINYDKLKEEFIKSVKYKAISKFPIIERDLAITLNENILWGEVEDIIINNGGKYLQSVKLFDVYRGDQVAEGKKSFAFNMIYSSLTETLKVEEIDKSIKDILKILREKLGAELR